MSFEQLLTELEEKTKAEEKATLAKATSEAKLIKSEASANAKQIMDNAKSDGEKLGNEQRLEIAANSKLKQKRAIAEAREKLIEKAINEMRDLLEDYTETKQYETLLVKLAKDCVGALGGKDAAIRCRKGDEKILKNAGGFNVVGTIDITGGVIGESSDGRIKVNNSLESLLEQHKEKLRQLAFRELAPQTTIKLPSTVLRKNDAATTSIAKARQDTKKNAASKTTARSVKAKKKTKK